MARLFFSNQHETGYIRYQCCHLFLNIYLVQVHLPHVSRDKITLGISHIYNAMFQCMILLVIFNGDFERKIFASTGIRSLDLPTHLFWRWESAILLAFLRLCGEPPFRQNFKLKCYWRQHVAKQIIVIALVGTKEGLMQKKIQKTSFDAIC